MILRTRLPFLCNMATTTCKPAAEPVLPLVRTVPENVQSRDTFCLHRLSRRSDPGADRKSTRLNSSHGYISYAVFCLKKKKKITKNRKCIRNILSRQFVLIVAHDVIYSLPSYLSSTCALVVTVRGIDFIRCQLVCISH